MPIKFLVIRKHLTRGIRWVLEIIDPLALRKRNGSLSDGKYQNWELWENTCPIDSPFPRRQQQQQIHAIRFLILGETISISARTVMDCGCGPAIDYSFFKNTSIKYIGIDITPKFITRAKINFPDIDIREMNMTNIKFDDRSIDVTYCKDVLEHLPPSVAEEAIREMWRVANMRMMVAFFKPPSDDEEEICKHADGFFYNRYNKQKIIELCKSLPRAGKVRMIEHVGDNDSSLLVIDKKSDTPQILIVGDVPSGGDPCDPH